jgi:molybdopterin/thiamine biosynthesis adenylyltransferase
MPARAMTRLALSEEHFSELCQALDLAVETAAVLTGTPVMSTDEAGVYGDGAAEAERGVMQLTVLAQSVTWVPETAYLERTGFGLSISSVGWVPAFRAAIKRGQVPVFVHTHPGGEAMFSNYDDVVDASLATTARELGALAYASMVVAGRSDAPVVICRMGMLDAGVSGTAVAHLIPVDAVRVAGQSMRIFQPPDALRHKGLAKGDSRNAERAGARSDTGLEVENSAGNPVFDRQVRMLGHDGQRTLGSVNVAVIGAGGTGSAVAVQLARIGVGSICLVDDDVVTDPTPTRGHGMRASDIGRTKVSVLGAHLRDIGLGTRIHEVNAPLHSPQALRAIQHVDVIFSCVDGHGARLILNRFAYAHLAVVIDVAVLVAVADSGVEIDERVTWIGPGTACLLCRGRLDAALAYAENLDPETRKQLAGEGYVRAAETPQPAVVTLTTLVAALAATEFVLRLVGLGSVAATELLLRPHVGELRRNRVTQRPGCFCSDPRFLARGQRQPYLDLMWPASPLLDPAGRV